MKDSISVIFATIIGTFLIVILPLYSILDRQDSMSYNVVLTETTNFVDEIRNKGFIDRDSYYNYISALSSTSNTYKVTIEAYKKILIPETDERGNIIEDSFVEELELYNTQDVLEILEGEKSLDSGNTNEKNNAFLFDVNDEIYVKVHNTNITMGSIIYNFMSGTSNKEVINVSYGGIVNKVNWELYDKIQTDITLLPEVVMAVPVNGVNSTNIKKINSEGNIEDVTTDVYSTTGENYTYLYDLSDSNNTTIKIAVELRRFDSLNIGTEKVKLAELEGLTQSQKNYIINNYIQLNGMYADIGLDLRKAGDYYVFDIILENVRMSSLDYISSLASVLILPGLGQDESGTLSMSSETVTIELMDTTVVKAVQLSVPHIWEKLLKIGNLADARIQDKKVYQGVDIAFVLSYTGINGQTQEQIKKALQDSLIIKIAEEETNFKDIPDSSSIIDKTSLEVLTAEELNNQYGVNIQTGIADHIIVKFKYKKYNSVDLTGENYIKLPDGWIKTYDDTDAATNVNGLQSIKYSVLKDDQTPTNPDIQLEGTKGNNDWYTSDVKVNLIEAKSDQVKINGIVQVGGSGISRNTMSIYQNGNAIMQQQEVLTTTLTSEGEFTAWAYAYDYVGNRSQTWENIKIDKTAPAKPKITLTGTVGTNGWYTSDVTMRITPGTDSGSGVAKTTYKITGANSLSERTGTSYKLTKEGTSTVTVTTYDKAGNKAETIIEVKIDKTIPKQAKIQVIDGIKNADWYTSDVKVEVTVDASNTQSKLSDRSYYEITKDNVILSEVTFGDTTKEINLTSDGVFEIRVYTYSNAGNVSVSKQTIKIDKTAPAVPELVVSGKKGNNEWYTSDTTLTINAAQDNGDSGIKMLTYKLDDSDSEIQINSGDAIPFTQDGIHNVTVYVRDQALNLVSVTQEIKIDKTAPTSGELVVDGVLGQDGWYTSNIYLSYKGGTDETSGIDTEGYRIYVIEDNTQKEITSITENTEATTVYLETKDNAGNISTTQTTVKVDKFTPSEPEIKFKQEPTGESVLGMLVYNKHVEIEIIPGKDYFLENKENKGKTTYEVTDVDGIVLIPETEGTNFTLQREGLLIIIARTYDKAGNVTDSSIGVWINTAKPSAPEILKINDVVIGENETFKQVTSSLSKVTLEVGNLAVGNEISIILYNEETSKEHIVTTIYDDNVPITVDLTQKGTYSIKIKQTNMFGTTSDTSSGYFTYKYE